MMVLGIPRVAFFWRFCMNNWEIALYGKGEKPLDRLVDGYSLTSTFRTIAFIGDSLSSGEFETLDPDGTRHYHDLYEHSWGQYIARKNGLTAYNFSKGGMTAKEYMESFAEDRGFWDASKAAQAYVIALGVNDVYNKNFPVGSMEDVCPEDYRKNKQTFLGYYAAIVQRYKEIAPDAKFFFVTFPNEENPEKEKKAKSVIDALYALAEYYDNCYVIDLYKHGPVYDAEFKKHFYLLGHMSPAGYVLTAQLIDSYIDYIVRHNPDEFRHSGFINTDIKYK